MRIAVSGTHCVGKTTLINDFVQKHPDYKVEIEPYDQLLEHKTMEMALQPSFESMLEELDYSIEQLQKNAQSKNIIFDRCPVDFLAYALCNLAEDEIDVHDSELSERFPAIKAALNQLDLILFLPLSKENSIIYIDENPEYRKLADKFFKKIYRDDLYDIFPSYAHPKIVEITGSRVGRLNTIETYLG